MGFWKIFKAFSVVIAAISTAESPLHQQAFE